MEAKVQEVIAFFDRIRQDEQDNRFGNQPLYHKLPDDDKSAFETLATACRECPDLFDLLAYNFYNHLEIGKP